MQTPTIRERWRVTLIIVALLGLGAWKYIDTNLNTGYSPVQPLPYSHRLHAGQYHIPCLYCHAGAERSRMAPIPALNVCMGCHSVVATNTEPIKKLMAAWQAKTPVQWQRVYQLPEFVKFNHRWHIAAGLACQTCHGPIQSMDQVTQVRQFTMGQCLDCHRNNDHLPTPSDKYHRDASWYQGHAVNAPYECSTCHN